MVATSGMIVHLHYCGEEVESWAVNENAGGCEDDPCEEGTEQEIGCCKDKVVSSKLTLEQALAAQFKLNTTQVFVLPVNNVFNFTEENFTTLNRAGITYQANAPPGNWQSIPLYRLHSSFTYYG